MITDPQDSSVPMFSPEGKLAQVPQEKYKDAIGQQFSPAIAVTSPEGQDAYLPHEKVDSAIKDYGFALGPAQQQPRTKMYTKSGQYAEIPENAKGYAQQQGWKPGVQMTSPLGIELTVHPDEAKKALDMGWGIGPAQQQEKPGFMTRTLAGMAGIDSGDIANTRFSGSATGRNPAFKDSGTNLYSAGQMTYGKTLESNSDILKYAGVSPKVYANLDDKQKNLVLMEARAKLGMPWEEKVAENLPVVGSMIRSGTKAVQSAKKGNISEAAGHGLAAGLPVFGSQAEASGEEFGQGHVQEGLKQAGLALAPFVAEPAVKAAGKLDFSTTPRSPLSKVVMPDNVPAYHAAEELAKPSIVTAAKEVGVKLETADDLLQAVKQAKQNTLLDAHESAGTGKTIADLAPEDQKAVSQKMAALDAVQRHVEDAVKIAKDAPEQPTKKEAAQRMLTGAAKMAGGIGFARMIPGGHWGLEIAGVGWGLKDLGGGLHDLVRSPILNETRLNGAVKDTFSGIKPEIRPSATPGITKPPFVPATDISVEHTGNVTAPKRPFSDIPVTPDEEPTEPETVSPYTPYTGNRAVTHETIPGPPTQPHGDINVTPDETLYPEKPVIKPPVSETDISPPSTINVPKTIRDPKTGRFTKNLQRGSSTTEEDADTFSKLPKMTVGTVEGSQNDTALFAQAKKNLGPDATLSQVAQEAQRMKMNQGSTPPSNKVGGYNPAVETEGLPSSLRDVVPREITPTDVKKSYLQYDIPRLKKLLADASDEEKPYYQSMIDQLTEKQKNMRGSGRPEEFTKLPFFSRAADVVERKLAPWFSPDQAFNTLKNAGVSADELDTIKPWLDQQGKKVQKQALLDHIENNRLKVNVTMKGENSLHPEAQAELDKIKDPEVKEAMKDVLVNGHLEDFVDGEFEPGQLSETYGLNDAQEEQLIKLIDRFGDMKNINSDVPSDLHKWNRSMYAAQDLVPVTDEHTQSAIHNLPAISIGKGQSVDEAINEYFKSHPDEGVVPSKKLTEITKDVGKDEDYRYFDGAKKLGYRIFQDPDNVNSYLMKKGEPIRVNGEGNEDSPEQLGQTGPKFEADQKIKAHEIYKAEGGKYGQSGTQYGEYTLPGGENYREMLIQAPIKDIEHKGGNLYGESNNFSGGHFDEPNVLAHVRMNDRTIDGKKTLFVEEVQSDWHQQGREKGYQGQPNLKITESTRKSSYGNRNQFEVEYPGGRGSIFIDRPDVTTLEEAQTWVREHPDNLMQLSVVPDAPFKKDWHELAMKQVLDTAVREGYDQVGWTTGKQQIDRYSDQLRQNVDEIRYSRDLSKPNSVKIEAFSKSSDSRFPTFSDSIPLQGSIKLRGETVSLDDVVGKEMAQKIRESKENGSFKGDDLTIGGSGMKGFYDEMLPQFMNRYTKKWGGRVKDSTLSVPENREPGLEENQPVHTIEITPKMKEEIKKHGQPISGLTEGHEEVAA